jgi:hypothetical protein
MNQPRRRRWSCNRRPSRRISETRRMAAEHASFSQLDPLPSRQGHRSLASLSRTRPRPAFMPRRSSQPGRLRPFAPPRTRSAAESETLERPHAAVQANAFTLPPARLARPVRRRGDRASPVLPAPRPTIEMPRGRYSRRVAQLATSGHVPRWVAGPAFPARQICATRWLRLTRSVWADSGLPECQRLRLERAQRWCSPAALGAADSFLRWRRSTWSTVRPADEAALDHAS